MFMRITEIQLRSIVRESIAKGLIKEGQVEDDLNLGGLVLGCVEANFCN